MPASYVCAQPPFLNRPSYILSSLVTKSPERRVCFLAAKACLRFTGNLPFRCCSLPTAAFRLLSLLMDILASPPCGQSTFSKPTLWLLGPRSLSGGLQACQSRLRQCSSRSCQAVSRPVPCCSEGKNEQKCICPPPIHAQCIVVAMFLYQETIRTHNWA